jgi:tetratricopeptide (TPR) repeat protein
MAGFDSYLKSYADSNDASHLRGEIADVWESLRSRNFYTGGPRSAQTDQAANRAITALKLASQTNDRVMLAEACRLMAHTLNANEQHSESLDYYEKAIMLFESVQAGEQAARTRLGYMAALYMTGKYDESLACATAAEQWFEAHNHLSGLAKVCGNRGNLYMRREQHVVALQHHTKARVLFEQLQDWQALAMTYLNLANCLSFADQLHEAEKMYVRAEELSARLGMRELFMQARYNRSYLMFLQDHCSEAIESFKEVRDYFARTNSEHHRNLCDLDVAEIYLHLMKPTEAVIHAKRAVEGFAKTSKQYEHAKALAFCAMGLSQIERLEEAEAAGEASRNLFVQEGNKYWIAMVDFCLAYLKMARGDVEKARLLAAQAKLQFKGMELKDWVADSLNRLGSLALEASQIKTAATCMVEVLKLTINKRQ